MRAHIRKFKEKLRGLNSRLEAFIREPQIRAVMYGWVPMINNGLLALAFFSFDDSEFKNVPAEVPIFLGGGFLGGFLESFSWYVVALSIIGSVSSIGAFFSRDIGAGRALATVVVHGIIFIVIFASVYRVLGLEGQSPVLERGLSLYFSIITWTTLGYGDFHPSEITRMFAALQAILGYIFLGLIVFLTATMLSLGRNENDNLQKKKPKDAQKRGKRAKG